MKMLGRKILLKTQDDDIVVDIDTIVYCIADGNQCKIKLEDDHEFMAQKPLKHMEYYLDDVSFFRINRGIIINLAFIDNYDEDKGMHVMMTEGTAFPVAVRRRKDFLEYCKYCSSAVQS